jgi:hypothetical protein
MQKDIIIQTAGQVINQDKVVKATDYRLNGQFQVFDISFKNVGQVDATINFSGCAMTLNAGDPMKSLGGYPGCVRRDEIPVVFSPTGVGTKIVEVYFTLKMC